MKKNGGLSKEVKMYIERELFDFEFNKRELEELKMDYKLEQLNQKMEPMYSANSSGECYSATENATVAIITNRVIVRMTRIMNAIQRVVDRLDCDKRNFYEVFYRQGKSPQRVCIEIGISRATFFRWRTEIVEEVGKELGVI